MRLDQQLVNCLLMPSSSSASARNLGEFLAGGGKGFPLFSPVSAYGGNWNQQQQTMMAMNRPGLLMDVGEVRRSSSHSSGSPHAGIGGGGGGSLHSDAKRNPNKMESGPIPTQLSPSVTTVQSTDPHPPDFPSSSSTSSVVRCFSSVPLLILLVRQFAIRQSSEGRNRCGIGRRRMYPHLQSRSLLRAVFLIPSSGGPSLSESTSSSVGRAGSTTTPLTTRPLAALRASSRERQFDDRSGCR